MNSRSLLMLSLLTAPTARAFVVKNSPSNVVASRTSTRMIGSLLDLLGGGEPAMVAKDQALKGRSSPMPNIEGSRHAVLGTKMSREVPPEHEEVLLANGCFWGSEKGFWRLPVGIHSTAVIYCGGYTPNPTYEEACSGQTGHTEGVRVVYNPSEISLVDILDWFWQAHDPTQGMGQGNDRGTQYRSGAYYFSKDQQELIEASKDAYEKVLGRPITTEIADATSLPGEPYYFAEAYHQQYLAKPGARPYCSAQPQGVGLPDYEEWTPFSGDKSDQYAPKLPTSFWKRHAPRKGCSVVQEPNEVIEPASYA